MSAAAPHSPLPLWERAFRRDLARTSCASRMAGRVRGDAFPTRLRRLPLTARAGRERAPPQGGSGGVCCTVATRHAFSLPRRAFCVRALLFSPHRVTRGYGAPKDAIHYGSRPEGRAGASRRANCGRLVGTGPRFRPGGRSNPPPGISQLLAGTPSGPGRSTGAARVLDLRSQARRRRASSRLTYASRNALKRTR